MLHPDTELRFVSEKIGYGIFATKDIPQGTMTWVKDELDRAFTPAEVSKLTGDNLENLLKYTYRDRDGNYFFCWDLTRYVNHSYSPNSMLTALGFEVAIRNIKKGEEITNDYGSFNIIEPFECANGPHAREFVKPDDLLHFHHDWDQSVLESMKYYQLVQQPLSKYLTKDQQTKLQNIQTGKMPMPSVLENFFRG